MLVSIVIINYNTFDLTCQCIETVIRHTTGVTYEIIVVDNASTKDNPDIFKQRFPSIKLLKSKDNGGFAKGNNIGIQEAIGDIILLLNSDVILVDDSISKAAHFYKKYPETGMLGIHLTYQDRTYQHNARKFRSIRNELLDLGRPLLMLMPYRKRAQLMLNQYFKGDFTTEVDWVSGAFLMFSKDVLQSLPNAMLDERFFMYGEDQLWCYQATSAGYKNFFYHQTSAIHIANASTEPHKQIALAKIMIKNELEIMKYRKGKDSLYYFLFLILFKFKETARYYIKYLAMKLFRYQIK